MKKRNSSEGERMVNERESNSAWINSQNLSAFEGKWIVVVDKKVVTTGDNPESVINESRRLHPKKTPYLLKVPSEALVSN